MPKKLGVNSEAEAARAVKLATETERKDREARQKEEQYWREAEGPKSRAAKKKEEEAEKKVEAAARKAEARRLAEIEEKEIEKTLKKPDKKVNHVAVPTPKVTEAELIRRREVEQAAVLKKAEEEKRRKSRLAGEEEYEKLVLVENKNRDDSVIEARSVEEAIAQMTIPDNLPVDKHQEKRLKASFKAFEEAELPRLKEEKPGLIHTQYKDMIWKLWKKSPDNPLNQMANEEQGWETASSQDEMDPISEDAAVYKRNVKRKRLLLDEAKKANKRGVCYLSRIPPHMDPSILRQMLSQYADVERIYLAPEDSNVQVHRKRSGKFRGQGFSEGWVEFKKRSGAKRVANMLNGEQIGGRKRSTFYYDIWNIKYLSKFKWDDLTSEKAEKNATQVQKLALETSAAKKERQFYINNLNTSIALKSIKERMKKKQKVGQDSGEATDDSEKVVRQFHQTNPIADDPLKNKNRLPKSFLQGIFGGSSDS